ncbi:MAG: O-antigen ligase family protein [Blastocatellia bacterium]
MEPSRRRASIITRLSDGARPLFWVSLALLLLVPLVFSTAVHRTFTLPKVALLLIGSATLIALLAIKLWSQAGERWSALRSRHVAVIGLYVGMMAVSTAVGVAPRVGLFGSFENQMGLMTRVCFLICCLSLILGIGNHWARLRQSLWVITITGLVAATYGFVQFFGHDPFLSTGLYTFDSMSGRIVRVISTLGHADYLGNFLLYTTPVSAALALAHRGRARLLALVAMVLSALVIVFSGTRGAILGLIVAALIFLLVVLRGKWSLVWRSRQLQRGAVVAALVVVAVIGLIAANPASRHLVTRARAAIAEGASGAGRTLLWRDTLPMLPAYGLAGCGPEGFRKAFLPYKSKALAQLAPQTNNESPHNAYLDAAISFGLPGAMLYVAVLASALLLLLRAGRRATDNAMKISFAGILSALAGVAVHNLFIFDQIPTGLYFFAFAALAQAALNVTNTTQAPSDAPRSNPAVKTNAARLSLWLNRGMALACLVIAVAAWGYALAQVRADIQMRRSFASAMAGDFDGAVTAGRGAADGIDPTGAYQFELARSLALFADVAQARLNQPAVSKAEADRLMAARASALSEAMTAAQASLAHTLTPDSNDVLLAYLALRSGDVVKLRDAATAALRLDPYFANNHWLMAEALLMEGDASQAKREAEAALEINPYSREARDVFKRARGDDNEAKQTVEGLLAQARDYVNQGQTHKARRRLLRALQQSGGHCFECHRALALVCESEGRAEKALAEWQMVAAQASDRAAIEEAQSHIASLKQKAPGQ